MRSKREGDRGWVRLPSFTPRFTRGRPLLPHPPSPSPLRNCSCKHGAAATAPTPLPQQSAVDATEISMSYSASPV